MTRRLSSLLLVLAALACPAAAANSPLATFVGDWTLDNSRSLALAQRTDGDQAPVLQHLAQRLRLRVEPEQLIFIRGQREDVLTVDSAAPEATGLRLTGRTATGRPLVLHLEELPGDAFRLCSDSSEVLDGCVWQRARR